MRRATASEIARCLRLSPAVLAAIVVGVTPPAAQAADSATPKAFSINRTATPPVIDGILDEAAWLESAVVDDFHQHTPRYRDAPTERTVVRVLYDSDYLYIGAELFDSEPDRIIASQLIQGRAISSDDRLLVALDTFNSRRNDYLFEVNANGVRREALREANSRLIEDWEAIWYAESRITDHGWSVEIAIPFKSLAFASGANVWGINFGRWITRKQEFLLWSSNERLWWAAESGLGYGIGAVSEGIGLDIVTSLSVLRRRDLAGGSSETSFDPSLDVLYRITSSLSARATINTDFSATEADERQIALDRFSLFFPEKRDFFLQDAGIFEFGNISTNGRPFFSRRLGLSSSGHPIDLQLGGKLTGRIGRLNVGVLGVRQEAQANIDASDLFVARVSANVLSESQLGMIMTRGDPASNDSNSLWGTDFIYRTSRGPFGLVTSGHVWFQSTQSSGADGDDNAFGIGFDFPHDRFQLKVSATEIQQNYRPALGFANRTGIRQYDATARNRIRPDRGMLRELDSMVEAMVVTDVDNSLQSRLVRFTPLSLRSTGNDVLSFDWEHAKERLLAPFTLFGRLDVPAGDFTFDRLRVELSSGVQRPVSLSVSLQDGGFFNGERFERSVEAQWRSSRHLFLGLGLTENVVQLPGGEFTARVGSLRGDVAFNAKWSLSCVLQYDNVTDAAAFDGRLRFDASNGKEFLIAMKHGFDTETRKPSSTMNEVVVKVTYTFRY